MGDEFIDMRIKVVCNAGQEQFAEQAHFPTRIIARVKRRSVPAGGQAKWGLIPFEDPFRALAVGEVEIG